MDNDDLFLLGRGIVPQLVGREAQKAAAGVERFLGSAPAEGLAGPLRESLEEVRLSLSQLAAKLSGKNPQADYQGAFADILVNFRATAKVVATAGEAEAGKAKKDRLDHNPDLKAAWESMIAAGAEAFVKIYLAAKAARAKAGSGRTAAKPPARPVQAPAMSDTSPLEQISFEEAQGGGDDLGLAPEQP